MTVLLVLAQSMPAAFAGLDGDGDDHEEEEDEADEDEEEYEYTLYNDHKQELRTKRAMLMSLTMHASRNPPLCK